MKVTLKFTGQLAKLKKSVQVEASTLREALTALKLIKEFNPYTNQKRYICRAKGYGMTTDLDKPLTSDVVNIICDGVASLKPNITGAGRNPVVRIVIGIILIVVAFYTRQPETAEKGAELVFTSWGSVAFSTGVSLILGGLTQLMMPTPEKENGESSKSAGGLGNTVRSGTPIPLLLGKVKFGGHFFSLNIETRRGKVNTLAERARKIIDVNDQNKWDSWATLYRDEKTGSIGYRIGHVGGSGGSGARTQGVVI